MYENKSTGKRYEVKLHGMSVPIATFLYKEHAETWKESVFGSGDNAVISECRNAS